MLWNYAGAETEFNTDHTIEDLTLGVSDVKLSEDASKLAIATIDSTIKVYSLDGLNPMLEREITPESIKICKIDIGAQATKCLYGTEGLILEDLSDGSTKDLIKTHRFVQCLALSPDTSFSVAGDNHGVVYVVNNSDLTEFRFEDHS